METNGSKSNKEGAVKMVENRLPQVVTKPLSEAQSRRMLRVLAMVHELHKAGYQRLRICPGLSGAGAWRCSVTPVTNIQKTHGAMLKDENGLVARHTGAAGNEYFGWRDAKNDTARELATRFVERFPEIARAGLGEDWNYAGWYVQMLGLAECGDFPIAYADWYGELDPQWLPTSRGFDCGEPGASHLPAPPGGKA